MIAAVVRPSSMLGVIRSANVHAHSLPPALPVQLLTRYTTNRSHLSPRSRTSSKISSNSLHSIPVNDSIRSRTCSCPGTSPGPVSIVGNLTGFLSLVRIWPLRCSMITATRFVATCFTCSSWRLPWGRLTPHSHAFLSLSKPAVVLLSTA